jgi:cell wall-associated NlpC family hydrolase
MSTRHHAWMHLTVAGSSCAALALGVAAAPASAASRSDGPAAAPTRGLAVGDRALIDVSVATLWRSPGIHRGIDRPSLRNPVEVNRWNRNLRTAAQRRWLVGKVQTQALYAQEVLVRERRGGWAKVAVVDEPEPQDPAGYPGWLPVRQLRAKADFPTVTDGSEHVVVLVPRTRVLVGGRAVRIGYGTRLPLADPPAAPAPAEGADPAPGAPGAAAPAEGAGPAAGEPVARPLDDTGWVAVLTPDGPGRVRPDAVGPPKELTASSILADARRFLRLRYLWGGLSAWGMDCSGIIWTLLRAHGATIPRDADPQFRSGRRVSLKRLQPGDFLFWGTQRYVHHVALYVGRGRMLEAPNSAGRVQIVPVRWRELVGARRYIR